MWFKEGVAESLGPALFLMTVSAIYGIVVLLKLWRVSLTRRQLHYVLKYMMYCLTQTSVDRRERRLKKAQQRQVARWKSLRKTASSLSAQ